MSRSPYITTPIRRFGRWELDLTPPPPVRGHLHLPPRPKATSDHYDYRHALHSDSSFGCSSCPESRTRRPPPKHRLAPPLSLIHISEPTRRTPISYAVFCLKKKNK